MAELSGEPISGALVELLDEQEERHDAVLAGEDGAFVLTAAERDVYRIRVQRIGFATWTSDSFLLEGAESLRLKIPVEPVPLAEIEVELAGRRCRVAPEEALRAWALYEEAVPLLEPIVWAETEGLYVYQVRVEESVPRRVRGRRLSTRYDLYPGLQPMPPDTFLLRAPVATLEPEALATSGYIQADEAGTLQYYSPTAATLVSAEFLDTHCLTTTTNDEGWEGVAFEPVPGREIPDVEGVLWLDRSAGELRTLEFRFTRLREMLEEHQMPLLLADIHDRLERDPRVDNYVIQLGRIIMDGEFGGRLEFQPLSSGGWITRRWELSIPLLGRATWLLWEQRPARVEGNPVAIQKDRRGEVTAVMAPRDVVDTMVTSP